MIGFGLWVCTDLGFMLGISIVASRGGVRDGSFLFVLLLFLLAYGAVLMDFFSLFCSLLVFFSFYWLVVFCLFFAPLFPIPFDLCWRGSFFVQLVQLTAYNIPS